MIYGALSIFVRVEIWRLLAASEKLQHVPVMRFDFLIVICQFNQLLVHILFVKCEFLVESTHVYQHILHKPFDFIFDIFDNFGFEFLNLRLKVSGGVWDGSNTLRMVNVIGTRFLLRTVL